MKFCCYTLGCKVNQCESQAVEGLLTARGHVCVGEKQADEAQLLIVNTCAVTAESEAKCRRLVNSLRRRHPDAVIAVTGCMTQVSRDPSALSADIIIGTKQRARLPELAERFVQQRQRICEVLPYEKDEPIEALPVVGYRQKTRGFLKIEDGCENFCSYCIIPYARGPERSLPLEEVRRQAAVLVKAGHSEIVLTGINLAAYGRKLGCDLADAVRVTAEAGAKRVRLGSIEADLLSDAFLNKLAAVEQFCPQFHLSLQSGSDGVLKRMDRHYTAEQYYQLTRRILERFKDASFTTDIMVGFPGETEEEFAQSVAFVQKVGFGRLHVFSYSPRPGTPAAAMSQVPPDVKKRRAAEMAAVGERLAAEFARSQVGSEAEVLFETAENGFYCGYTRNYTPVRMRSENDPRHQIHIVRLTESEADTCIAQPVR
ncbi:MAG: tRNA (N(6)-L-threonylcarbamoyladenosine(37)-C(2))-methylthiotransferase MtaB [Clostridia bacterium]|nr:tRNA (N(6)-L-threonylcarbamoyladenosine(37)-C(2))-methylthiotransferase MtaB [Clostridia bacterium]